MVTAISSRRRGWLIFFALLTVALFVWRFFLGSGDPQLAKRRNNEGVALIEQFNYVEAKKKFEEVQRLDPDWTPGKINLAIATLNLNTPETTEGAARLCLEVLQKEPKHPHANYLLGIIYMYRQQNEKAHPYFQAVLDVDPQDAYSWYYLGDTHAQSRDSKEALQCYEKALSVDPYLNVARYRIAFHPQMEDAVKRKAYLEEFQALQNQFWEVETRIRYYDMGPYARVISAESKEPPEPKVGPLPKFEDWGELRVELAEGTRWALTGERAPVFPQVKSNSRLSGYQFPGTWVQFDFDGDNRIDLLLLSAVVRGERVGHLLLHHEGGGKFKDVTPGSGLEKLPAGYGVSVADFDNDGSPDFCLTGSNRQVLMRNLGGGKFEDVSVAAGLDQIDGTCLTSAWVDLDQDADLDLILCRSDSGPKSSGGGLLIFLNTGLAPLVEVGEKAKPLSVAFTRKTERLGFEIPAFVDSLVATDFDADFDVDLVLFGDGVSPVNAIRNHRLLRFEAINQLPFPKSRYSFGCSIEVNRDGKPDLFAIDGVSEEAKLFLSKPGYQAADPTQWFTEGKVDSPRLVGAFAIDLDRDGWTDLVGTASSGNQPVFLQNTGKGELRQIPDFFGKELPKNLQGITCLDLDGDCQPDLLMWTEEGLKAKRNLGNGNQTIQIKINGKRSTSDKITERSNSDGIGAWVVVQSGDLRTAQEYTTRSAGLGQSLVPLEFGIGTQKEADVVRIRWPDLIPQAERQIPPCKLTRIEETNRKPTSCPTLLIWDGERYRFVSDILGAGSMGELGADGSTRPPRPEESFKIEPGILKPKDGKFLIKLAEPMDETMYLDRLELLAMDHPEAQFIYPDERFPTSENPSQELLFFQEKIFPQKVTDHRGRDHTQTLREWDGREVNDFALRRWTGFAEDHYLEFDFTDALKQFKLEDRVYLCLAGWTDYAYPDSIFAALQAKVEMQLPTLELQEADGSWKPVLEVSLPAGLPRMMTREVTGKLAGKFRLRSNLQIFWDQIFLARRLTETENLPVSLPLARANLSARGFIKEFTPRKRGAIAYDDTELERVEVTRWKGRFTRLGDVTELLQKTDDQFVICGPGDEVVVAFDDTLPPLRGGFTRSFVLRSWGYCKDTTAFTAHGGHVEPLPYRAMGSYPPQEPNPAQREYDRKWNTRLLGR